MGDTYNVKRMYLEDDRSSRIIERGLTLEEAQAHCQDPETSWSTCQKRENVRRTERCGPWFDGYEKE